jgi:hypothetical protein
MHDRSLQLRILSLLKIRRNKMETLYLSNHRPNPRNKLTTYGVMADREAKLSLNSQIVSVPDEKTYLDKLSSTFARRIQMTSIVLRLKRITQ